MAIRISKGTVDAETAQITAGGYLLFHVGDLFGAGTPRLTHEGRWDMPIEFSNVRRGIIGQVGTISVDAETGAVLFSKEECEEVKAQARLAL